MVMMMMGEQAQRQHAARRASGLAVQASVQCGAVQASLCWRPRTTRTMLCASAMRAASSSVSPSGDDLHARACTQRHADPWTVNSFMHTSMHASMHASMLGLA